MSDDPASAEAFEWETTMAFAHELTQPWDGMGSMANHQRRLAAELIVRLYNRCTMEAQHIMEIRQQVEDLRGERDEARREVSKLMGGSAEQNWYANRRGWDCFKDSK
jgi:hypothetical protein